MITILLVLQSVCVDKKDMITGADIKPGDVLDRHCSPQVFTAMDFLWCARYSTCTEETLNTYYDELRKNPWRGTACTDQNLCKGTEERIKERRCDA